MIKFDLLPAAPGFLLFLDVDYAQANIEVQIYWGGSPWPAKKVYLFNLKKVEHLPFLVLFEERGAHKVGQMDRRREAQETQLCCYML